MFDDIKTFRSYIQSKGRARMKGGEYILLIHNEDLYRKIMEYRSVEQTLNTVRKVYQEIFRFNSGKHKVRKYE